MTDSLVSNNHYTEAPINKSQDITLNPKVDDDIKNEKILLAVDNDVSKIYEAEPASKIMPNTSFEDQGSIKGKSKNTLHNLLQHDCKFRSRKVVWISFSSLFTAILLTF